MMLLNRPEFGIIVNSSVGGYIIPKDSSRDVIRTRRHHSLVIVRKRKRPVQVITDPGLVALTIPDTNGSTINSPYLSSLCTEAYNYGSMSRQQLRNLVLIQACKVFCNPGLRHIRLVRFTNVSCCVRINPGACLEILMMARSSGPMHSTSSPYRFLATYDMYGTRPSVPYVRKNKEPMMIVLGSDTIVRHRPSIIRAQAPKGLMGGSLMEENGTAALIVPPKAKKAKTSRLLGRRRSLGHHITSESLLEIFAY